MPTVGVSPFFLASAWLHLPRPWSLYNASSVLNWPCSNRSSLPLLKVPMCCLTALCASSSGARANRCVQCLCSLLHKFPAALQRQLTERHLLLNCFILPHLSTTMW